MILAANGRRACRHPTYPGAGLLEAATFESGVERRAEDTVENKINLAEKLAAVDRPFSPRIRRLVLNDYKLQVATGRRSS